MKDEDGAGTVLALALCGLLMFLAVAVSGVVAIVLAHRISQSAADLSALAGAAALQDGHDPCARAAATARRNHARLVGCQVRGWEVVVTARSRTPALWGDVFDLDAAGRAGPALDPED